MRPPRPAAMPVSGDERRARDSARPDHGVSLDRRSVRQRRRNGVDRSHRDAERHVDTHLGEPFEGVEVRAIGERAEQHLPMVDQTIRRLSDEPPSSRSAWNSSASAPAVSTPVGPPPQMTTVQRVVAAGGAQLAQPVPKVAPKPIGVAHRVQREGVLGRPGDAEEVRLRPGRDHEVICGAEGAGIRRDGLRVHVDRDDLSGDDWDLVPSRNIFSSGRVMLSAGSCELATW